MEGWVALMALASWLALSLCHAAVRGSLRQGRAQATVGRHAARAADLLALLAGLMLLW